MVGGIPKATRCGRGSHPEGAGGGGEGTGMGRSGLGHCVLVEVRRYESIKNHFLPNSCQERGEQWSERPSLIPHPFQGIPEPPTCLSGAGPCLCPCPDAARAPGSAPGNNPRADRRCGADPGAAGCSRGTGWESAPGIGAFSFGKRADKTQRVTFQLLTREEDPVLWIQEDTWSCCWSCCCRIWPQFHAGSL